MEFIFINNFHFITQYVNVFTLSSLNVPFNNGNYYVTPFKSPTDNTDNQTFQNITTSYNLKSDLSIYFFFSFLQLVSQSLKDKILTIRPKPNDKWEEYDEYDELEEYDEYDELEEYDE